MPQSNYVHIVDGVSQRRASIAKDLAAHGLHPEIYDHPSELGSAGGNGVYPKQGAILLSDDEEFDLVALLAQLRAAHCFLPVIVYTSDPIQSRRVVAALRGGAFDYFHFPTDFPIVGDAVEDVIQNAAQLSRHAELAAMARLRVNKLTPRERNVLIGVIDGLTSKDIARREGISPRTVEVHRAAMLNKLEVATTAGAVATGIASGILQDVAVLGTALV